VAGASPSKPFSPTEVAASHPGGPRGTATGKQKERGPPEQVEGEERKKPTKSERRAIQEKQRADSKAAKVNQQILPNRLLTPNIYLI
jgi:hypothetical protein